MAMVKSNRTKKTTARGPSAQQRQGGTASTKKGGRGGDHAEDSKERVTIEALLAISSSDDEAMPPEEAWDSQALALKKAIASGVFDQLLRKDNKPGSTDEEDESIEEVVLGDEDDDDDRDRDSKELVDTNDDELNDKECSDRDVDNEDEEEEEADRVHAQPDDGSEDGSDDQAQDDVEYDVDDESDDHEADEIADEEAEEEASVDEEQGSDTDLEVKNQMSSKALQVITEELAAEKRDWPWAETFVVIPPNPLPFNAKGQAHDVHDDLKREVAFYDLALEAVRLGRLECQKAGIPFSRPDDFFAEMIKSDDHVARIKDRLIFETKKMDAVAQRKVNKEQKLRAKEMQSNRAAESAKRKKEHLQAVQEWAQSAASMRGGRMADDADDVYLKGLNTNQKKDPPNKKRQAADRKYGYGGKRGRFKQNDPKSMDDMSNYNPRGNFAGGQKKAPVKKRAGGSGAKRKGKRARDSSRAKRR